MLATIYPRQCAHYLLLAAFYLLLTTQALPAAVATRRDAAWREALTALAELSSAPVVTESNSVDPLAGQESKAAANGDGHACASIAASLLVDAAATALGDWASGQVAEAERPARAMQLMQLLQELIRLRLADGAGLRLSDSSTRKSSAATHLSEVRSGPLGHLVVLAPSLIACIGRPLMPGNGSCVEASQLQDAVRDALTAAAVAIGL